MGHYVIGLFADKLVCSTRITAQATMMWRKRNRCIFEFNKRTVKILTGTLKRQCAVASFAGRRVLLHQDHSRSCHDVEEMESVQYL